MQNINTAKFTNLSSNLTSIYEEENLVAMFSLKDEKGREIFEKIKQSYFSKKEEQSELTHIKRAFLSVKDEIEGEAIVASLIGNKIFCLCFNGAGAALKRSDSLVPLLKTNKGEYSTVAGVIKPGDFLVLATHNCFASLTLDAIKDSLVKTAEDSIESFSGLLTGQEEICVYIVNNFLEDSEIDITEIGSGASVEKEKPKYKNGIKSRAVNFIDKLLDKLPNQKLVIQQEGVDQVRSKRRKTASLVGIVLIILLSVSIYFGRKADDKQKVIDSYEPQLMEAIHNLTEAKELASLSPVRAQELLGEARDIAIELEERGIEDERLSKLFEDIRDNLADIAGIYEDEPQIFIDLSIIASNFSGNNTSYAAGLIRVLDNETKRLVGVEIDSKRTEILANDEFIPSAVDNFSYEDRSFVVSNDGIREVTGDVELVIKDQEWIGKNIIAKAFAGNVYVLDTDTNNILRYQGVRGGFQEGENWLAEDISINFSEALDLTIDGEIWVLNKGGIITRLSLGVPRNFSLSGDRVGLIEPNAIFSDEESEYLYILDPASSKILIINKDGQYIGEYSNKMLEKAQDFIVAEEQKLIVFLAEGKLYSLEVKHIKDGDNKQESEI